ncbi:MAG TPA: thiol-disulfide oxidoreductase DCC family protein [Fimbriimonas sp.]
MSRTLSRESAEHPVVFFDGVCNLCNSTVDFIVRHDPRAKFRFAPLQGETAAQMIPEHVATGDLNSFVLVEDGRTYTRSTGALRLIAGLGGAWALAKALLIVPAFLRDAVYRLIAKNRYRIFGKKETCRLPTPEERTRFLP